jgi:hypothetical protein
VTDTADIIRGALRRNTPKAPGADIIHLPTGTTGSGYANTALQRETEAVATAPEGTRNDQLNRSAFNIGQLIAGGELAETEARTMLGDAARAAGLEPSEIRATLDSGISSGKKHPRTAPPRVDTTTGEILTPAPTDVRMPDKGTIGDFWNSRTALRTIRDAAHARMTAPWATLGNALAHIIAATPPDIVLPAVVGGKGCLNLFVGIVGPSGAGKGASGRVADQAINILEPADRVNVGTGEGLISAYVKAERGGGWTWIRHNCLIQVAEIDTLAAVAKRQGATIMPVLRSAWSGETLGFQNRDATTAIHVPDMQYRMALVAGIQPARAEVLLGDADGGTPQRFMWMPATHPDATLPDGTGFEPWPWRGFSDLRHADDQGHTVMTIPSHVEALIQSERIDVLRGDAGAIAGHDTLARVKIAAALAILDHRLEVRDEDWQLSGVIHNVSLATRTKVSESLQAARRRANVAAGEAEAARAAIVDEGREEAAQRRLTRWVVRRLTTRGPATARELRAAANPRDRGLVESAIDRAISAGQVRQARETRSGTVAFEAAE